MEALCHLLDAELHRLIVDFMGCVVKSRFPFDFFGKQGYKCEFFMKTRLEFQKWKPRSYVCWGKFFLSVATELACVAGLTEGVQYIRVRSDLVRETVQRQFNESKNLSKTEGELKDEFCGRNKLVAHSQDADGDMEEAPSVFYAHGKYKFGVFAKQTVWGEANSELDLQKIYCGDDNEGQGVFTTRACRFDSFLSILIFLHSNLFSPKDKKEFDLNLPALSMILKLLKSNKSNKISFEDFRYLSHSMLLLDGEKNKHGPIRDVYVRFKELTGASEGDRSIMSLFASPYFEKSAFCPADRCDMRYKRSIDTWKFNMLHWNTWESDCLNPIESSFLQTFNVQNYCVNCSGPLTHESFLQAYQNYYAVFCTENMSGNLQSVATLNFISMQYRLVSIVYTNFDGKVGEQSSDHFLSIICKTAKKGKKSYFLCNGAKDYRTPVLLKELNEFPARYGRGYWPELLIYQKITEVAGVEPIFSDTITVSDLEENDFEYAIKIQLREKIEVQFEPDKRELAKYFLKKDNVKACVRGVAFSSDETRASKNMLSYIYACMQVFFHNKVLAHNILTSNRDSELLLALQKLLIMLRYSTAAVIEYNTFVETIVSSENVLLDILKADHGSIFVTEPMQNEGNDIASWEMTTLCVEASNVSCISIDQRKLTTLESLSILNGHITDEECSFKEKIVIGGVEFMLVGFIYSEESHDAEVDLCSAYVKDLNHEVWYRFYFDKVEKKTEHDISSIFELSLLTLNDEIFVEKKIAYLSYVKCGLDVDNFSKVCEEAFESLSAKNSNLVSEVTRVSDEGFLPMRNVIPDFCNDQLYIRRYCHHGSCRKEYRMLGNIMPLKYLEACYPTQASSPHKFYNFCTYGKDCEKNVVDVELEDSPPISSQELPDLSFMDVPVKKIFFRRKND